MKSNFNPPEALLKIFPDNQSRKFLIELMNALPNIVAILNEDRRLLYSNQTMLDAISISNFEEAFNLRPGELFSCVNSEKSEGGCGASEACELCGAMRAMTDSKSSGLQVSHDCKILSEKEGIIKSYNFKYTSTPFQNNGLFYFVISIEDISHSKRKAELERIFFHDVMNSIGSLQGGINLLKKQEKSDPMHIKILEASYNSLYDTINEQKQFSLAENGELETHKMEIHSRDILIEASLHFNDDFRFESRVIVSDDAVGMIFYSDETLLIRILVNMIKNALEASEKEETVSIGANSDNGKIKFWVHNQTYIKKDIQLLIFERAYSTKGSGRGLGTFSMKLLGENYLHGKVDFVSTEDKGTTFWIELPLS